MRSVEINYELRPIHTWFRWHKCSVCETVFRREPGWFFRSPLTAVSGGFRYYVCAKCIPTEQGVFDHFRQLFRIMPSPRAIADVRAGRRTPEDLAAAMREAEMATWTDTYPRLPWVLGGDVEGRRKAHDEAVAAYDERRRRRLDSI